MSFHRATCVTLIYAGLCVPFLKAQDWSISGAAAVPERTATGANKTTPFFDPVRGSGVSFLPGARGRAVLYLPVTALHRTTMKSMALRVSGVSSGYIKADLFEESATGPAVRLGALAVVDRSTTGSFVLMTNLIERPIDNTKNTYSVRIEMCNDSPAVQPAPSPSPSVLSLSLYSTRCNCPPPPPTPWTPLDVRSCRIP